MNSQGNDCRHQAFFPQMGISRSLRIIPLTSPNLHHCFPQTTTVQHTTQTNNSFICKLISSINFNQDVSANSQVPASSIATLNQNFAYIDGVNRIPAHSHTVYEPPIQKPPVQSISSSDSSSISETRVNQSPPTPRPNLMSEADSSIAIAAYTKYYTDVLAYFKTLLTSIEDSGLPKDFQGSRDAKSSQVTEKIVQPSTLTVKNDPWEQPKTVMDGYFNRLDGDRNWDWASWHNYLSWISRTHPEWFRLFTDCSRQMGINWDEMYQKWLASQAVVENTPTLFDPSCPPPMTLFQPAQSFIPPPGYVPPTNAQSFFPLQQPSSQDTSIWCEDCDQYFETERAFNIHFRGVRHIQNALTKTITRNPNVVLDIPPSQTQQWSSAMEHQKMAYNQGLTNNRFRCMLPPPSQRKPDQGEERRPRVNPRLQHLLDICIKPLIGLNYIVEFQRRGLLECIYTCDLCHSVFLPGTIIKHVCSVKHRMAYLKLHYPPLHLLLAKDRSDNTFKAKRLYVYAQKIEEFEGRKRLSLMLEKENSTLKTRVLSREQRKPITKPPSSMPLSPPLATEPPELSKKREKPPKKHTEKPPKFVPQEHEDEEEIEEGEMLDYTSSSSAESSEDEAETTRIKQTDHREEHQDNISTTSIGVLYNQSTPLFGICASPSVASSSSFCSGCSSDEENEPPSSSNANSLPSFFCIKLSDTAAGDSSDTHSIQRPYIHLPDFETLFISERPLLPIFSKKDTDFLSYLYLLSSRGLLRLSQKTKDKIMTAINSSTIFSAVSSTDDTNSSEPEETTALRSFEEEADWALKRLGNLPVVDNHFGFLLHQACINETTTHHKTAGLSIEVICSKPPQRPASPYIEQEPLQMASAVPLQTNAAHAQPIPVLGASVRNLLQLPPPPPLLLPRSDISAKANMIPVLTSHGRQPITSLPSSEFVSMEQPLVRDINLNLGVLGDPPGHIVPKKAAASSISGINMVLSSPLEALQNLLNSGHGTNPSQMSKHLLPYTQAMTTVTTTISTTDTPSLHADPENLNQLQTAPKGNCLLSPPVDYFDGYSFSQRPKSRKRSAGVVHEQTESTPSPLSRSQRRPEPKKRLAAIADMLGVNEPPAPRPSMSALPAATVPSLFANDMVSGFLSRAAAASSLFTAGLSLFPGSLLANAMLPSQFPHSGKRSRSDSRYPPR